MHWNLLILSVSCAACGLVAALVYGFGKPLAIKTGLVDLPGGRKHHQGAVPLTGGTGLFLGLAAGLAIYQPEIPGLWASSLACALLFVTGLIDDRFEVRAAYKLLVQIVAAAIVVYWGGAKINGLGNLFYAGPLELGWFGGPFSIACIVAYTNALNMSDGIDGLAGTLGLVAVASLLYATGIRHNQDMFALLAILACGLVTFLIFNARHPLRNRAALFLGDSGSLLIGFSVAWAVIYVTVNHKGAPIISSSAALWLVGLPVLDLTLVMARRMLRGRSPFAPDREHLHHLLLVAGFSVNTTVLTIATASACMSTIGLLGMRFRVPEAIMFSLFAVVTFACAMALSRAWRFSRALQWVRRRFQA